MIAVATPTPTRPVRRPRPPDPADILAALQDGRPEVSLAALATALGCPKRLVRGPLRALAAAGLAELWPGSPEGPAAILGPLAVVRLGLRLTDGSRWVAADAPDPPFGIFPSVGADDADGGGFDPDALADSRACRPLDLLIEAETIEAAEAGRPPDPGLQPATPAGVEPRGVWKHRRPTDPKGLPRPTRFLGFDLPWPVPQPEGMQCRGCGGPGVGHAGVWLCLHCHRYAKDHLIPPVEYALRPRPYNPPDDGLQGGRS